MDDSEYGGLRLRIPKREPVVRLANSDEVGGEIVRALGLPLCTRLTLVFKSGQPVEVTATSLVEETAGDQAVKSFIEQTARYRLQRVEPAPTSAEIDQREAQLRCQSALNEAERLELKAQRYGGLTVTTVAAARRDEVDSSAGEG